MGQDFDVHPPPPEESENEIVREVSFFPYIYSKVNFKLTKKLDVDVSGFFYSFCSVLMCERGQVMMVLRDKIRLQRELIYKGVTCRG